jgi:hypothetical protein
MKEFVTELTELRVHCSALAGLLAKKHEVSRQEPPLEAFGIFFNYATHACEITSHYDAAWGALSANGLSVAEIERKREENKQRLGMIGKHLFISSMSAAEFAAKRTVAAYPLLLDIRKKGRLYLGDIISRSVDQLLVDAPTKELWDGAIRTRNCVVHNNGIADETREWKYSDALSIKMTDGQMTQGTMMTFPRLTRWVICAYAAWSDGLLAKHRHD